MGGRIPRRCLRDLSLARAMGKLTMADDDEVKGLPDDES